MEEDTLCCIDPVTEDRYSEKLITELMTMEYTSLQTLTTNIFVTSEKDIRMFLMDFSPIMHALATLVTKEEVLERNILMNSEVYVKIF